MDNCKTNLWDNNEIQFARLICEIVANCYEVNFELVRSEMDLDAESFNELFERAHKVWEKSKNDNFIKFNK